MNMKEQKELVVGAPPLLQPARAPARGLERAPRSVLLIAGGPSNGQLISDVLCRGGELPGDEAWVTNSMAGVFRHDRIIACDDLRAVQSRIGHEYGNNLRRSGKPIVTSTPYPEFPTSIRFPLEEVSKFFRTDLWSANTCSATLALAIYLGAKEIYLYGFDMSYPSVRIREEGSMACAFLLGWCAANGIQFHLPETTALMNVVGRLQTFKSSNRDFWHYYGFEKQPWEAILTEEERNEYYAQQKSTSLPKGARQGDWGHTAETRETNSVQTVHPERERGRGESVDLPATGPVVLGRGRDGAREGSPAMGDRGGAQNDSRGKEEVRVHRLQGSGPSVAGNPLDA